jgi:hypothetical protein
VTDRGLFSRPLLSRLVVTEEEKKRQVDNRRFCIPTVAREFMKDTGPFDPLVQSTLHGPQGYCWLIPRPEEDPTKPIEVGAKYSLPRGPTVQRFEALEGEEEVTKPIGKKGSKKKKSLKSIDAELAALVKMNERPVREPVADLEPVLRAKTVSYPVPYTMVNCKDPAPVGEASFSAAYSRRAHWPPGAEEQWEMLAAGVSHTSDYLKDADFQARFPVFSDIWPEHRKHPLNQAMFGHHPKSTLRLNLPECPISRGIETPYYYPKCNCDHFCWHQEQDGLAAWHHCLSGATQWYLVPSSHRQKFLEVAQEFIRQSLTSTHTRSRLAARSPVARST